MNIAMVIIPASLVYIGLLFLFINRIYLRDWVVTIKPVIGDNNSHKLARFVHGVLHIAHSFAFFVAVVWPPLWVALVLLQQGNGAVMEMDMVIKSGFILDVAQLDGLQISGIKDQILAGSTQLRTEANLLQWFLYSFVNEARAVLALFVILHARNIFACICNGAAITKANAVRLRWIGVAVLVSYLCSPLWQFWLWAMVIDAIHSSTTGLAFTPDFDMNFRALFVGLVLLVLSGVLKEAVQIKDEQELTI